MTDPLQAEFQALYPPHIYFAMSPGEQAQAWAQFLQNRQLLANQTRNRQTVTGLLIVFIVIPAIIGLVLLIVFAATGAFN